MDHVAFEDPPRHASAGVAGTLVGGQCAARVVDVWTARAALQLAVLATASFIYVTAEVLPVAALPAIASDLHVSEAVVGTLLASYAMVAAVTTVPLVRWTSNWPRRRTLLLTLMCLTASQLISALAPNFLVLAGARVLCAITHGLLWSVIAPIGARLLPPTHSGRATTAVYLGTSIALVAGNPLTAAVSQMWGWRLAVIVVTAAAAVVTAAAWTVLPRMAPTVLPRMAPTVLPRMAPTVLPRMAPTVLPRMAPTVLPRMALTDRDIPGVHAPKPHHRNGRLVTLSVLTLLGVTGHFISYTFIVVIIRDVVGVHGPKLAWLLAAYGIAGLLSMALLARTMDRSPVAAVVGCVAALVLAYAALGALAIVHELGLVTALVGIAAIVLWGASASALAPMLQSTAMRSAPRDPDGASGLYVAAFQVGIMAGSLSGGVIYQREGVSVMIAASTVLATAVLIGVLFNRGSFRLPAFSFATDTPGITSVT